VNNGAIVIEVGGITEQTCAEVGAAFDIREPKPPILYRIAGRTSMSPRRLGFLLSKLTRQGAKLVKGIGAARNDSGLPEDEISTADWVSKYTKNEGVHGIFRNMCASIFRRWLRGPTGAGSSHLLHPQERLQAVRLPSGGHHRAVALAGLGDRVLTAASCGCPHR
jgi:hypothetical protein